MRKEKKAATSTQLYLLFTASCIYLLPTNDRGWMGCTLLYMPCDVGHSVCVVQIITPPPTSKSFHPTQPYLPQRVYMEWWADMGVKE